MIMSLEPLFGVPDPTSNTCPLRARPFLAFAGLFAIAPRGICQSLGC